MQDPYIEEAKLVARLIDLSITWDPVTREYQVQDAVSFPRPWLPRTEDGDAFRLMVDLNVINTKLLQEALIAESTWTDKRESVRNAIWKVAVDIAKSVEQEDASEMQGNGSR